MLRVPSEDVIRWEQISGGIAAPSIVRMRCPHCAEKSLFSATDHQMTHHGVRTSKAVCPDCMGKIVFISIDPLIDLVGSEREALAETVEDGDTDPVRTPIVHAAPGKPDATLYVATHPSVPTAVRIEYAEAAQAFAAGLWRSSMTQCLRAVAAVVQHHTGGKPIEDLQRQAAGFAVHEVFRAASHEVGLAFVAGAGLGSTLDGGAEVSGDKARSMLSMLDLLLRYLYILPDDAAVAKEELLSKAGLGEAA